MPSALVVDSDRYSAVLLRHSLERCGYRAEIADSSAAALVAIRSTEFAIMFVDAAQLDDALHAAAPARTVVTSAKLRSRVGPILERAGMPTLLRKPIRYDELRQVLEV